MKKRETLIYTILLGSSLLLCPLRSTAQEKKTATTEEKATVPLYQGTYVGLDVFGLGSKIFGSDFTSAEVSVEVNLKNRFIPIIEIGYGHTDTTDDETNIHYKASAPYLYGAFCALPGTHQHEENRKYRTLVYPRIRQEQS